MRNIAAVCQVENLESSGMDAMLHSYHPGAGTMAQIPQGSEQIGCAQRFGCFSFPADENPVMPGEWASLMDIAASSISSGSSQPDQCRLFGFSPQSEQPLHFSQHS
jgi:hypothetical protein